MTVFKYLNWPRFVLYWPFFFICALIRTRKEIQCFPYKNVLPNVCIGKMQIHILIVFSHRSLSLKNVPCAKMPPFSLLSTSLVFMLPQQSFNIRAPVLLFSEHLNLYIYLCLSSSFKVHTFCLSPFPQKIIFGSQPSGININIQTGTIYWGRGGGHIGY